MASVNDINGGVKDSATEAMRSDLYSNWEDTVVIDIDEYNSMANELANIKSQLLQLQDLLVTIKAPPLLSLSLFLPLSPSLQAILLKNPTRIPKIYYPEIKSPFYLLLYE